MSLSFHLPVGDGPDVPVAFDEWDGTEFIRNPYVTVRIGGPSEHLTLFIRRPEDAAALRDAFARAVEALSPVCNSVMWDRDSYGEYPIHDEPCPVHHDGDLQKYEEERADRASNRDPIFSYDADHSNVPF